jgi:hypothetical protein
MDKKELLKVTKNICQSTKNTSNQIGKSFKNIVTRVNKQESKEQQLLDLKEEFCKWYCPNKDNTTTEIYELCFNCMIEEYICYIKDQLL